MNKRNLMLSAATAALLTGPAFATTCSTVTTTNPDCVTTGLTTALTTGAQWNTSAIKGVGTAKVGDIYIESTGSVAIKTAGVGAITVDSNSYVYSDGAISNDKVGSATMTSTVSGSTATTTTGYASGILIDVSKNEDLSGASFTTVASTTTPVTGAGIYMDSASSLDLTDVGTYKRGIWLDATNGDGTYTGDITFNTGSTAVIDGDQSYGILISSTSNATPSATTIGATLKGNLTLGGAFTVSQTTASSTTASGLYGLLMEGKVIGNISIPSGGSMTIYGAGATGMSIQGAGVTGSISIGGSLTTIGEDLSSASATAKSVSSNNSNTVYPEAGSALVVTANVTNGIAILGKTYSSDGTASGSVTSEGTSATPAIVINPGLNNIVDSPTYESGQTAPLTIGVYTGYTAAGVTYAETADPGFSFYNRGTISQTPMNYSNSASDSYNTLTMEIVGASYLYPTILTGGIYNSGSLTATAATTGTTANYDSAMALEIGAYTVLDTATWDAVNKVWLYNASNDPSLANKGSIDQAALVNTNATGGGTISASISGTRGGFATAIDIAADASVPSLINSGTISATATVTDQTITNPLEAIAIEDASGTLTSIYNTGTISARAGVTLVSASGTVASTLTALNNDSQTAIAIDLSGDVLTTPSGSGVTITVQSTSTSTASIIGDIRFGEGDNQILTINPTSAGTAAVIGDVSYGKGTGTTEGDQLTIGANGELIGIVTSDQGSGVAVDVKPYGTLELQSTTTQSTITPLYATTFDIESYGNLSLGVTEALSTSNLATVIADKSATIAPNADLGVAFESFVNNSDTFVLITAPHGHLSIAPATINLYNTSLQTNVSSGGALPFLFSSANLAVVNNTSNATDELVLNVVPKTLGKGTNQLNLTAGSVANTPLPIKGGTTTLFALANTALANDDVLGAAMVNGIHNTAQAQAAYNSFAPNVTGGSRAILVSITDQATGVVGARLRMLNLYGKQEGGTTLWGQEFFQMIKDPGQGAPDPNTGAKLVSGFKDHGFGFALGIDGGSPKYGWYGGAFTFYSGDVGELTRDSHTNEQWYLLTGYSAWRGKGLFFDSKIDAGYGQFSGKRFIDLALSSTSTYTREADNKHPGTMISGGFTTGGIFDYGAATFSPLLSVDGMLMREEGYTEYNPGTATVGDGFDLKVNPYYAKSLRAFLGANVRYDLDLWDFYLQPEAHAGYRYDFFNDPVKLKAAFAYADTTTGTTAGPGTVFTMTGPDPAQGNFVVGGSLAATTDTWTMGVNFDFVKGSNGTFEEVGTLNLLGRI